LLKYTPLAYGSVFCVEHSQTQKNIKIKSVKINVSNFYYSITFSRKADFRNIIICQLLCMSLLFKAIKYSVIQFYSDTFLIYINYFIYSRIKRTCRSTYNYMI